MQCRIAFLTPAAPLNEQDVSQTIRGVPQILEAVAPMRFAPIDSNLPSRTQKYNLLLVRRGVMRRPEGELEVHRRSLTQDPRAIHEQVIVHGHANNVAKSDVPQDLTHKRLQDGW